MNAPLSTAGPIQAETLAMLAREAARRWPDKAGLVIDETGERLSFAEIDRRSNAIANALIALGVAPGDRIAVMLENVAAFPLAWLGIGKAGAAMVPINVFYRSADAGYLLANSGARALVTAEKFLPVIAAVDRADVALEHVVVTDRDADAADGLAFTPRVERAGEGPPPVAVYPEMLANIQYTSGTTGRPKGCMMSHRMWLTMCEPLVQDFPGLGPDDVLLSAQPYYYMDPSWNFVCALMCGGTLVLLDRFHPTTLWSKLREHRATFFYCLGVMPTLIMKMPVDPDERDHALRMVTCSAIPTKLHEALEERFGVPWYELYGMTEIGLGTMEDPDEHLRFRGQGYIGRPPWTREARAVDADGRPVPRGEPGELVFRGPGIMDGYFRNPEANAEVFRDGWFYTGDRVRMDAAGRVFYLGRTKDIIRRSGENISAAEVEEVIAAHPAVRLAACLPVPDELRGEEVKAYVVLAPDAEATPQELAAWCEERLAYFKIPRYWSFRDELPRTPSERVAKGELKVEAEDLRTGAWDRAEDVWR